MTDHVFIDLKEFIKVAPICDRVRIYCSEKIGSWMTHHYVCEGVIIDMPPRIDDFNQGSGEVSTFSIRNEDQLTRIEYNNLKGYEIIKK